MKFLGEIEAIETTITEGQSSVNVVFSEVYTEIPKVYISETDGCLAAATSITITGCTINSIESKSNPVSNTGGRTIKLSICI